MPHEEFVTVTFLILSDSWMTYSTANSQSNVGHLYAMWLFIFPTTVRVLFHIKLLVCLTDIISFLYSCVYKILLLPCLEWNWDFSLTIKQLFWHFTFPFIMYKGIHYKIALTYLKGVFLVSIPLLLPWVKMRCPGLCPNEADVVITGRCTYMMESIHFIKVFPRLDFLKVKCWPFFSTWCKIWFLFLTQNRGLDLPGD